MKIRVECVASEETRTITLSLGELGLTQGDWASLSDESKLALIKEEVDNLPDQPYWCVDKFNDPMIDH